MVYVILSLSYGAGFYRGYKIVYSSAIIYVVNMYNELTGGFQMYKMKPEYAIGISKLDEQHQTLFSLIDDAQTLMKDENIL